MKRIRLLTSFILYMIVITQTGCVKTNCTSNDASCNATAFFLEYLLNLSPVAPCNPCRMFVTSTTYTGNLGGISGADSKCMIDTIKPTGTYKALLVDETGCSTGTTPCRRASTTANAGDGQIDWVLKASMGYVRASDGITIGTTDASGLMITQTNSVTTVASSTVWLGLRTNWIAEPLLNCINWTDGGGATAVINDQSTNPIISGTSNICSIINALLCAEQ